MTNKELPTKEESELIHFNKMKKTCMARLGSLCNISTIFCKREKCFRLQMEGKID